MRSEPVGESELRWNGAEYTPAKPEQPRRAYAVRRNLARGHALVHGRQQLTQEDLPLIARVTVSSIPTACAQVFIAAVGHPELTVVQAQRALGVRQPETARRVMKELDRRGVMEYHEERIGKAALKETEAKRFLKECGGRVVTGQPILQRADRILYDEVAQDLRQHYHLTG